MSASFLFKKFSTAGAVCLLSAATAAQQYDDVGTARQDVIAQIETLTVVRLSYPPETATERVNLANIYCSFNQNARSFAKTGGVVTLEHGTEDDLQAGIDENEQAAKDLGLMNEAVPGFAMAYIDNRGQVLPAFTFAQGVSLAGRFKTDADLVGVPPAFPGLIERINDVYLKFCFGTS